MKKSPIITYAVACLASTNTFASHHYTNAISAHNIATFQHTISQTAFSSSCPQTPQTHTPPLPHPLAKNYGQSPLYGTMSIYGEYNDDGRSAGDTPTQRQTIHNARLDWQHISNDIKFDEIAQLDSKHNLYLGSITSNLTKIGTGYTAWGIYTGYLNGTTTNHNINIDTKGGFFGIYNRYQIHKINMHTTINGGVTSNITDTQYGTDETTNFWIGGTANITYDINLDNSFFLRPNVQIGYTWIKSENYTSASGDFISNDAFNMIEFTPGIRAIKHIGNNWYGALDVRHVMIFANNGDITVNDTAVDTLNYDNFTEYGISLEKSVTHITLRANIGRREGSHSGWTGGLNFKYLF